MPMDAQDIARMIREGIPGAVVEIEDLHGEGEHYAAHVRAGAFEGKSRIQQHQMVFAALKGKMGTELHALAVHTAPMKGQEG